MKKKVLLITALVMSLSYPFGSVDAQTRGRQNTGTGTSQTNRTTTTTNKATSRPATNTAPSRPSTGTNTPAQRPATGTNNTTQRPGTTGTPNNNPNPGVSNQRPGTPNIPNTGGASQRPGTPNRPAPNTPNRPNTPPPPPPNPGGYRPNYSYRPPRPHTPPSYTYYRPTPPPTWRPTVNTPSFGTFLGITLGSLLAHTVNSLYQSGYNVTGYTSNEVYLNNVSYANVNWPNATLYYNNGYLQCSLFSTSSLSYDPSRYNYVYNTLTGWYGLPVSNQSLSNGGMSCTWWGAGNTYLTLSYYPEYVSGYGTRYFTTLAVGN